jgi:hypothetical protein
MTLMTLFRPLTPREMARWTLRIYAQYWPQWLLLAALTLLPLLMLNTALLNVLPQPEFDPVLLEEFLAPMESGELPDPAQQNAVMDQLVDNSVLMMAQLVVQILSQLIMLGVIAGGVGAVMTAAAYRGEPVSLGAGLAALRDRAATLLAGHALVGGALIVLVIVSMLGLLLCVGALGLGFAVYMYLAWVPLMPAALTLEDGTLNPLMRRAWQFGKQRVWLLFSAVIVLFGLRFVLAIPFEIVLSLAGDTSLIGTQIATLVVEALTLPLGVIFYTLVYEDTRARLNPAPADDDLPGDMPPVSPESAARMPLLTSADLPNIVGVSMVALMLLGLMYVLFLGMALVSLPLPF